MEQFAIPGVGGIIEKNIEGKVFVLIQERCKEEAPNETGLIEIPAGKIRACENIFDSLRREIKEETGLNVIKISGEAESIVVENNGYKVINFAPFSCAQNLMGEYPIMVQVFICEVRGEALTFSNESRNLRWISVEELRALITKDKERFYAMHITTLEKYIKFREGKN